MSDGTEDDPAVRQLAAVTDAELVRDIRAAMTTVVAATAVWWPQVRQQPAVSQKRAYAAVQACESLLADVAADRIPEATRRSRRCGWRRCTVRRWCGIRGGSSQARRRPARGHACAGGRPRPRRRQGRRRR